MKGQYVYLNTNSYVKDGVKRAYSAFADSSGAVTTFNSSGYQGTFPDPFDICVVDFQLQQYGRSAAFILENFVVVDKLVSLEEQKGGK